MSSETKTDKRVRFYGADTQCRDPEQDQQELQLLPLQSAMDLGPTLRPPASTSFQSWKDQLVLSNEPLGSKKSSFKSELIKVILDKEFQDRSDFDVLAHMKGILELYSPFIKPSLKEIPEDLQPCFHRRKVGIQTRIGLARDCQVKVFDKSTSAEPTFGAITYIGSPIDGDMVVINEPVVSEWLTYIRGAVNHGIVDSQDGLLDVATLSKLTDVYVIPAGRHTMSLDLNDKITEEEPTRFIWTSSKYPYKLTTCKTYT